jgi:hypothetical protein
MSEITVSWDASPTPGASYDVFRGQTPGGEAVTPYATGVVQDPTSPITGIAPLGANQAVLTGTIFNGAGNYLEGMKVSVAGFVNAANNGVFMVVSSTASTVTVNTTALAVVESAAASLLPRPYFTDTAVLPGQIYVYKIDAVVGGVHSLESLEVISEVVPFGFTPIALGLGNAATSFEVLAGSTATNTGPSMIDGEIGVWPGTSLVGFGPPAMLSGGLHAGDFVAQQAQADLTAAFNAAMAAVSTGTKNGDIGGQTLTPGVYTASSSLAITGQLYLNAQGNPDAVWIFQIGSTLGLAAGSCVMLMNGAQSQNVFWAVGSSATLNGPSSSIVGTIMAQASITATAGVNVNGRLLARVGAVTLIDDVINMQISSLLGSYGPGLVYTVGEIIYDCVSNTFQQVVRAGTTGSILPVFSPVIGTLTHDGSVIWKSLDHSGVLITVGLPPAPANTPPPPPAPPTNVEISSEN